MAKQLCKKCGGHFDIRGFHKHEAACDGKKKVTKRVSKNGRRKPSRRNSVNEKVYTIQWCPCCGFDLRKLVDLMNA